jgi:YidC/Oxa1 family membrane protein insertase
MSQPAPRSNIMQTLLIAAVIFLGLQLFLPKGQQAAPADVKSAYETAIKSGKSDEILRTSGAYAKSLRTGDSPDIAAARKIEFESAKILRAQATERKDFTIGLNTYNELHRLTKENPNDDIGRQAATEMSQVAVEANNIARGNEGLTRLGYGLIDGLVRTFGGDRNPGISYWLAAVVLAVIVRMLVWPLANKQMIGFKRMAQLQPMIKELQQKYQGAELNERTMRLYQKYGINPLAGCWPMLIQMPFFLWIFYSMRMYQFEFHKGTFLWINPGFAERFQGIVAPNLGERDVPLVLLYGVSMLLSTLLSVTDPNTAKQSRMIGIVMAVVFTGIMLVTTFPSAFILYWIILNVISTIQSVRISRIQLPPLTELPESQQGKGFFGGMKPVDPKKNGNGVGTTRTGAPIVHKPKKKK